MYPKPVHLLPLSSLQRFSPSVNSLQPDSSSVLYRLQSPSVNGSPATRDEIRHPEHQPAVVFTLLTSRTCSEACSDAIIAHFMFFSSHPVICLFTYLARHAFRFHTLYGVHFLTLVLNLVRDIYKILIAAHVLYSRRQCPAVHSHFATMCSLFRRHDFAVLLCRSMKFHARVSLLQCLSRNCLSWCLCPSTMKLRLRPHRQCFCLAHRRSVFTRCIPKPPVAASDSTSQLPPGDTLLGGGCSRLSWATLKPYVSSKPSTLSETSNLHYVAYVDETALDAYPRDEFVHAVVPLQVVSQLLSVAVARQIAAIHGIEAGSRCTIAHLNSCVDQHKCFKCKSYTTIFSIEKASSEKAAM